MSEPIFLGEWCIRYTDEGPVALDEAAHWQRLAMAEAKHAR